MQILKRGDVVLVPAKVTGFGLDGDDINVETLSGRTSVYCIPSDSVGIGRLELSPGDRISFFTNGTGDKPATVLGSTDKEVWLLPDGAAKSITINRTAIKWRLPEVTPELMEDAPCEAS